ncbi:hypothetical protein I4U23_002284 [Adineta vaga]|nr:hypothetical protein I4U23_002284 [Adineta vaga]
MSQLITYNSVNDGVTSRRYTGYPLNSTLVSSYTPDTIRSIINHAAAGQPYSTSVWIRINRVGIQISAQDPQIARTRIPVFIPIGLVHDIYMLPSINNVICVVYDELQSNMKGVLLYVIHPSDAQLLRDDFRIVKQASNSQQAPAQQPPYSSPFDNLYPHENNQVYTPAPSKSPLLYEPYRNNTNIRHPSPRRILYNRENESNRKPNITPTLLSITHSPYKGSYHSDREEHAHRRHRSPKKQKSGHSPAKRSSDSRIKQRKHRSRSPEKQVKPKPPTTSNSLELTPEQLQQQQQQMLLQQQQQMAAWQASQQQQQMPLIPMGIYNRYVPKTIPLPTGETLRTTLPPAGTGQSTTNGSAVAYIEPQEATKANNAASRTPSRSRSNSPRRFNDHQQNRSVSAQHSSAAPSNRHHHRRHRTNGNAYVITRGESGTYDTSSQQSRSRSKYTSSTNPNYNSSENEDDTKQYLKMLIDEMQAMKLEMNRMRQLAVSAPKGRSDSIHADIKDLRTHIDLIRSRIAMTPKITEK